MDLHTKESESWQRRRSDFNHNWLKNTYLGYIRRLHKILDENKKAQNGLRLFLEKFPEWELRQVELITLINEYGDLLSPKTLLNVTPLNNLEEDYKLLIGEKVDEIWKLKNNIPEQIKAAKDCLEKVESNYDILKKRMENVTEIQDISDRDGCKKEVKAFIDACEELNSTVNKFHNRIRMF